LPFDSSTTIQGKNWSFRPAWLLILTGVPQVVPPSVERTNQMRDLQVEAALVPGPLPLVQPESPERSFQVA
jgi:hypothetical protein